MFAGIDFGTSNSAIALAGADGAAHVVDLVFGDGTPHRQVSGTARSMLAFDHDVRDAARRLIPQVGLDAIHTYLEGGGECRLLQSFKSYLTSRSFTSAAIFNTVYSLEEMIALVVGRLRAQAQAQGGGEISQVVAGRPVRFVAEDGQADEGFALDRLRQAFAKAGISHVEFEYEPIAAAYYHEQGLTRDEVVLVADFGGGTSDFCLMRLGPGRRRLAHPQDAIIATGGVGNAGDALDRRIVDRAVAEFFGKNATYRSHGKTLPVPAWIYGKFSRWHHIGFLDTRQTRAMLDDIARHTDQAQQIHWLLALIEYNLGFHLYRAVERVKLDLSSQPETVFRFDHDPIDISRPVTRAEFEEWISPELAEIETCVDDVLAKAGMGPDQVDRVFMTGGTSLVPAVRRIFANRFGDGKLSAGGEFVSVATGLAYRAREMFGGT